MAQDAFGTTRCDQPALWRGVSDKVFVDSATNAHKFTWTTGGNLQQTVDVHIGHHILSEHGGCIVVAMILEGTHVVPVQRLVPGSCVWRGHHHVHERMRFTERAQKSEQRCCGTLSDSKKDLMQVWAHIHFNLVNEGLQGVTVHPIVKVANTD